MTKKNEIQLPFDEIDGFARLMTEIIVDYTNNIIAGAVISPRWNLRLETWPKIQQFFQTAYELELDDDPYANAPIAVVDTFDVTVDPHYLEK